MLVSQGCQLQPTDDVGSAEDTDSGNPIPVQDDGTDSTAPQQAEIELKETLDQILSTENPTRAQSDSYIKSVERLFQSVDDPAEAYKIAKSSLDAAVEKLANPDDFTTINRRLAELDLETIESKNGKLIQANVETLVIYVNPNWRSWLEDWHDRFYFWAIVAASDYPGVETAGFLNAAYPEDHLTRATLLAADTRLSIEDRNLFPAFLRRITSTTLRVFWWTAKELTNDLLESYLSIFSMSIEVDETVDGRNLADDIQSALLKNQRVILVTHSDGSLAAREALRLLTPDERGSVGAIMLGSPLSTSDMSVAKPEFARWIGLRDDFVAVFGYDEGPSTQECTSATQSLAEIMAELQAESFIDVLVDTVGTVEILTNLVGALRLKDSHCSQFLLQNFGCSEHPLVECYLTGNISGDAFRTALEELRCLIELPQGGFGANCDVNCEVNGAVRFVSSFVSWDTQITSAEPWLVIVGAEESAEGEIFEIPAMFFDEIPCDGDQTLMTQGSLRIDTLNTAPCSGKVSYSYNRDLAELPFSGRGPLGDTDYCLGPNRSIVGNIFYEVTVLPGQELCVSSSYEHSTQGDAMSDNFSIEVERDFTRYTNGVASGCPSGPNSIPFRDEICIEGSGSMERTWGYEELAGQLNSSPEVVSVVISFASGEMSTRPSQSSNDCKWEISVK